ncbi:CyP450 monooxygenase [Fomitopsis schrenkii]|uniref:CyP450 monooxygenase n=1 Tax=Fomitopsis schrenkii TaxID=2126942 RepID=S8EB21_FOMSC|nr:CyP450 monooxygenase [Fomitopsis schrenkii]
MPKKHAWLAFTEWANEYGPVMYLSSMGSSIIVLSSLEVISDLFDKKSAMYSDRPLAPMAGEFAGFRKYTAFMPYCHRHREGRKLILGELNARKLPSLQAVQEEKTAEFLSRMAQTPSDFRGHVRWLVAAIVLQIAFGLTAGGSDDPFVLKMAETMENLSEVTAPGAYLVDSLPFLKHVPEWFPGAAFKIKGREVREFVARLEQDLYLVTLAQLERGETTSSFVADFLNGHRDATTEEKDFCREVATNFYGAGTDTTISAILSFILIMAQHPHIQRKAQEEIDAVVVGRPPRCNDRQNTPYLEAVLKEVHRWHPVLPIALPHQVLQEDVYAGYRIPAGCTVFANTWAIFHDPELYPLPNEVIPERYLGKTDGTLNPDPRDFAFGYGRRVCPGRVLAEDTLFIAAATLLASFNISNALPLKGDKIAYTSGIISRPEDFACRILPRKTS